MQINKWLKGVWCNRIAFWPSKPKIRVQILICPPFIDKDQLLDNGEVFPFFIRGHEVLFHRQLTMRNKNVYNERNERNDYIEYSF
tara:strand:+ start:177 stop:431 length:255 start_codon:yes stop_codon:yes gene_type:complete